jgi:hypothetical protein
MTMTGMTGPWLARLRVSSMGILGVINAAFTAR